LIIAGAFSLCTADELWQPVYLEMRGQRGPQPASALQKKMVSGALRHLPGTPAIGVDFSEKLPAGRAEVL
jgi:hypothetical protein